MTADGRAPGLLRPLRVLIVDDEARWRDLLVDVLPDMGFAARGARNAEEAIEIMSADRHDLMILDLHLPGMSGIELFEHVRATWPVTQAVIITAYGELSAAQHAIRLRVAEFLTKPCHLAEVESALERARALAVASTDRPVVPHTDAEKERPMTLAEAEQRAIEEALVRNGHNKAAAARELGISRRSLYDRIAQHRPDRDASAPSI